MIYTSVRHALRQMHHLLNNKAEVNQRDEKGMTPLHRAAFLAQYDGYLELYEYLLVSSGTSTLAPECQQHCLPLTASYPHLPLSAARPLTQTPAWTLQTYARQVLLFRVTASLLLIRPHIKHCAEPRRGPGDPDRGLRPVPEPRAPPADRHRVRGRHRARQAAGPGQEVRGDAQGERFCLTAAHNRCLTMAAPRVTSLTRNYLQHASAATLEDTVTCEVLL